ncbi:hypothetical protein ACQR1I_11640 [Bradyrhizobium sp. HKCCYLS2038]|uniref:hypothetical protein n=1 Tax=unclassified Bradyrhizobium TaxID=2631580 RepID=UPI003EB8D675
MKRNQKNQTPHGVYVVEGEGDNAFWTRIGAAWLHQANLSAATSAVALSRWCR